jgi:branched-chain amino acid transport system substrate-binding protein
MPPVPPLGGTPPPPAPPGGPAPSSRRRAILIAVGAIAALLGVTAAVLAATGAFDGGDDKKPRNVGKTSIETTDTTDTAETQTPGGTPIAGSSLTIYSSLPQQGASAGQAKAMQNGAQLAIDAVDGRVGDYSITYKPLDDSLASTGQADEGKALQNARTAVSDDTAVGYIGEYNSGISKVTLPVLNQGGIAQVSPSNTYVGLTTDAPGSEPGEPDKYYPTGRRTYARIAPNDTVQAAAIATAAADSGCSGLDIWHTKTTYAAGLARNLEGAATEKGLEVHSVDGIDPEAPNYRSLAGGIRGDCFAFTGEIEFNGVQAMKDAAASPKVDRLFSGDGLCLGEIADPQLGLPAKVASRFRCTIATLDASAYPPAGKKFFEDYSQEFNEPNPDPYAINGYESMALLLDAIDRASQGGGGQVSRDAVVDALFETTERDSVLGNYSIDENGDTSITDYGLYKASGRGLEFDRVVKP